MHRHLTAAESLQQQPTLGGAVKSCASRFSEAQEPSQSAYFTNPLQEIDLQVAASHALGQSTTHRQHRREYPKG